MGQETELKFVGPEESVIRLQRTPLLLRMARGRRARTRNLQAIYFDTDDFALRDAGFVLRVRTESSGFVQTVKSAAGPDIATRTEVKGAVAGMAPDIDAIADDELRAAVAKAVGKEELKPIFTVDVRRVTLMLTPSRGIEIEAAFDRGTIKTVGNGKNASQPISEVELELMKGSPGDLVDCARLLTADAPLLLSLHSKAERGYALVQDEVDAPASAKRIALAKDCTVDDAFAQIIASCLQHLLGNWPSVVAARDPEGIHQMRVAIRRMRSALSLFPFRKSLNAIETELHALASVLGKARDLDVFQDSVLRQVIEAVGEDDRMLELATLVRARRRMAWHEVLDVLGSERFRRLVLDVAAAIYNRPWSNAAESSSPSAAAFARKRLKKRRAKVVELGKEIAELDAAERHALRRRLKRLRYAVDFFASLFAKKSVKRYAKRMSALQDVLGTMNDAAMARALVLNILAEQDAGAPGAAAYAGGVVAGWHLGHTPDLERQLQKRWSSFVDQQAPWA